MGLIRPAYHSNHSIGAMGGYMGLIRPAYHSNHSTGLRGVYGGYSSLYGKGLIK